MREPSLRNRRILVTAGPTWVWIDAVRHIGNVSTGRTGLAIARTAAARGASVTLLLGPALAASDGRERETLQVIDFVTFDDLHGAVREQVSSRTYDAMVHAAAVSDYRPVQEERAKLPSGQEELVLRLRPTPRIVDEVKTLDPDLLLVKFKLEVGRGEAELLAIAAASRIRSRAELIVANDLTAYREGLHPAFLLDESGRVVRTETTAELADRLVREIELRLQNRPFRTGEASSN